MRCLPHLLPPASVCTQLTEEADGAETTMDER